MLTHEMGVVRAFPGFLFGMSLWAYRRELARLPYADGILLGLVGLFIVGAIVGADKKIMFALTYGIAATALAADQAGHPNALSRRSEEHTSELPSIIRISYDGFCVEKKNT